MFDLPKPLLVGMVHLPPLPGSPRHSLPLSGLIEHAAADAGVLADAGFDALMVENFGDTPFPADSLEPVTIAAMAVIVSHVKTAVALPVGVNALRNDARSALGIAAACEADFIRVNVHAGVVASDQGMLTGRADETLRLRQRLGPNIGIFADVHVKHATPISHSDIAQAAADTAYRGLADVLIVTGSGTGHEADLSDVRRVKAAVPDRPVLVGSGVTSDNVSDVLAVSDGIIIGTGLKPEGRAEAPVDPDLAQAFIRATTSLSTDG